MTHSTRGQATIEYAILFGLVVGVVVGMQLYLQRGVQAGVKTAVDWMSPDRPNDPEGEKAQIKGMRYESGNRQNSVTAVGTVLERVSATRGVTTQQTRATMALGGGTQTQILTDQTNNTGAVAGHGPNVSSYSKTVIDVR